MRVLHTADWHLGKNLEGQSRLDEQSLFLEDFIQLVEEQSIDLIVIAGDIYDTSNPPSRAENLFYESLKALSNNGQRMILVISGNHDNPDRLVAARPLASEHGIVMVAMPKSVVEVGSYGKNKIINSGEGFIEIEINNEKAVILTIPYPSEKRLNEILYKDGSESGENLKSYNDRIRQLFDDLSIQFREDTINLVVSHLFAMGAEEAGSERSIQLGGSYIVDSSCFPEKAQYVALGHIHKPMVVPNTNQKVRYSGSPLHYNKKEIGFEKGCYIFDVQVNALSEIEWFPFRVYKPIQIWRCDSIEEAIQKCSDFAEESSWVYLEVKTDRYISEEEIKKMKNFKKDILEIMPKIVSVEHEESHLTNLIEKPFAEIFKAFYFKTRKVAPDDELVDLLLSITGEEVETDETN